MGQYQKILLTVVAVIVLFLLIRLYIYLKKRAIRKLVYSRRFSDEGAHEGMETHLIETIYNPTFFILFRINIESNLYSGIRPDGVVYDSSLSMHYVVSSFRILLPFSKIERRHVIHCEKRGFYQLETVEINFNKETFTIESEASVYVYPKAITMVGNLMHPNSVQGENPTNRRLISDPFSFSGIRNYVSGDPMKNINYKATARSASGASYNIMVNKFDYVSNRNVMIYIDYKYSEESISTTDYETIMENALRIATAMIREASESGYRVGFSANCKDTNGEQFLRFSPESGTFHYVDMLKRMSLIRAAEGISMQRLIEKDVADNLSETEIVIFSNQLDGASVANLERLSAMGNSINTIKLGENFLEIDDIYAAG